MRPLALFGLEGLDEISHAMLWSMFANVGLYVTVSILTEQSAREQTQARPSSTSSRTITPSSVAGARAAHCRTCRR